MNNARFLLWLFLAISLFGQNATNLGEISAVIPTNIRFVKYNKAESVTIKIIDDKNIQLLIIHINASGIKQRNDNISNKRMIHRIACGVEYIDTVWIRSKLFYRHTSLKRLSEKPFPAVVTALYSGVNRKRAEIADAIISSIEFNEEYYKKISTGE